METIRYLKCSNCGYEDSAILPMSYKNGDVRCYCPKCEWFALFREMFSDERSGMTLKEYVELIQYIDKNHGWRHGRNNPHSKIIKYVRQSFDTRTNTIFSVQLDNKDFTIVNENRHKNLKKWIYEYLDSED